MTQIISSVAEWQQLRRSDLFKNQTVGFVPTMGALHAGHQQLLKKCKLENSISILSIFVNPTQFNNPDDLQHYPVTLETDIAIANAVNMDFVFLPDKTEMYPDGYQYRINENHLSQFLCGAHRPGHFDGVLTIVFKLLNLIQPHNLYMGEKDFQQYQLVKGMVDAFFMDVKVVPCPTVRDNHGLALSSRNQRLSKAERQLASQFPQILLAGLGIEETKSRLESSGFVVDYVADFAGRRCAAVTIGQVRLIDNVQL